MNTYDLWLAQAEIFRRYVSEAYTIYYARRNAKYITPRFGLNEYAVHGYGVDYNSFIERIECSINRLEKAKAALIEAEKTRGKLLRSHDNNAQASG